METISLSVLTRVWVIELFMQSKNDLKTYANMYPYLLCCVYDLTFGSETRHT